MSSHRDVDLPIDERVELLLAEMTVSEKSYQLVSVPPWYLVDAAGQRSADADRYAPLGPGHICNFGVDDPVTMARIVGALQHTAVEGGRLGIPLLIHAEALNGFLAGGHMVFPTPTGLAATWSPELVEEMADVIRSQMKRVGVRQALSPNMDIALDPRWGRVHESYGEDPYLVAALSVAFTRGLQSPDLRNGVIATAKHFVAYGMPQGGMNLSGFEGGTRLLRDLFAYPFEAAIQLANLQSVMNSYADIDGIPAAASPSILSTLLRDTLGFDGFVSSDYMTLEHIVTRQHAAETPAEAARLTIVAGLDTEFPTPYGYGAPLADEVTAGRVEMASLDASVRRVLTAKFRLGLFENPYPQETIDLDAVAAEGSELSRELARRSVVLLKNDGILPLKDLSSTRVALIGPHADAVKYQFPTYSYPAFRDMTVFMSSGGMGNMVGIDPGMAAWNNAIFAPVPVDEFVRDRLGATSLADELRSRAADVSVQLGSSITRDLEDEARAAESVARDSDVVVLALGGASLWFNGERTEGEASDSVDIELPAAQVRLVERVAATGTPFVVVLTQGRAYALPDVVRNAAAIVVAPYGGPFGPAAVVEVLAGELNPSGHLPYSIPVHSGQIPVYHHQRSGTGQRNALPPDVSQHYLDLPAVPLYAFGHGLSYTSFELGDTTASESVSTGGAFTVEASVVNTGKAPGTAVVQLYLSLRSAGVTRPAQQLAGFARVDLAPGERRTITFSVQAAQLGCTTWAGDFAVEPGPARWSIGFASDDIRADGPFEVVGDRRPLAARDRAFLSTASAH